VSKILGSICSLERLYFLKHYYPTHGDSIGGIHFGNEQIKEADHIGMKMYAWNDFLKVGLNHPFINILVQMHERDSHTYTNIFYFLPIFIFRLSPTPENKHCSALTGIDLPRSYF